MYYNTSQRHRAVLRAPPCGSAASSLLHCVAIRVHAQGAFPFAVPRRVSALKTAPATACPRVHRRARTCAAVRAHASSSGTRCIPCYAMWGFVLW